MIYAGTDLKFKVTASLTGFSMQRDNFSIIIKNRWGKVMYLIEKSDMLTDSYGNYYFVLDAVPSGYFTAIFSAHREDTDYGDDVQTVVDSQPLVEVVEAGHGDIDEGEEYIGQTEGMAVVYKRVWTVCVEGYIYLAESDGTPILDANGERIYLKATGKEQSSHVALDMTADQLKELLEGRNSNGRIDTVPEMLDAAGGLPEDTEIDLMTEKDADDMMSRILGREQR